MSTCICESERKRENEGEKEREREGGERREGSSAFSLWPRTNTTDDISHMILNCLILHRFSIHFTID